MAVEAPPGPPIVDGSILETHKENIVPSRDGRSALAISQLYSVPRAQRTKELAATHAMYRERIDAIKDDDFMNDDDPIDVYCQYVGWIMNNYPSGSSSESGLLSVLEEATRRFSSEPVYENDKRYVRLWMEYANLVEQAERVYAFMLANDIGSKWPHVYEEYALILERNKNFSKADKIYRLAIYRRVSGLAALKLRYKEFQARCVAQPSTSTTEEEPAPPPTRPPPGGRTILGSRMPASSTQQQQSQSLVPRTPSAQTRPRSNLGKIAVFVDSGTAGQEDAQTNEWPNLQTRGETFKENKASAVDGALHQRPVAPRTPKVAIFRDGPTTPASSLSTVNSPEQVFRPKTPTAHQDLSRDPLRNFGHHLKFDIDLPAIDDLLARDPSASTSAAPPTSIPPPAALAPVQNPQSQKPTSAAPSVATTAAATTALPPHLIAPASYLKPPSVPIRIKSVAGPKSKPALPEPPPGKRREIAAFDMDVVYHNGDEFSRWETRARGDGLLGKKWPAPPVEVEDDSDLLVPLKEQEGQSGAGASRRSMGKNRQSTTGRLNGSPTTNTKAALNDVFDMFNSTVQLTDIPVEEEEETGFIEQTVIPPRSNFVPMTPTPLTNPAKNLSWTPLIETGPPQSSVKPLPLRIIATPAQASRETSATPRFEVARDPPSALPATTPGGGKFAVFQEKTPAPTPRFTVARDTAPDTAPRTATKAKFSVLQDSTTPAATPRFTVARDAAAPLATTTPAAKFAVFQENGEKRLPSFAKPAATPLAPKPLPAPAPQEEAREPSPVDVDDVFEDSASRPSLTVESSSASGSQLKVYSARGSLSPSPAHLSASQFPTPTHDDEHVDDLHRHPKPLVFKDVQPPLRASTSGTRGASPNDDDVFRDDVEDDLPPPDGTEVFDEGLLEREGEEEPYEEEVEDSYMEDDFDGDDIHPRSYEMRGGVAIMTPITERTLEYENTRASLARRTPGGRSSASDLDDGERILDGLSPSPAKLRSYGRPSLTTRSRRSSIKPRTSMIREDEDDEAEAAASDDALPPPLNPFSPEYVEAMLETIWPNLDLSLYRDLQHVESTYLAEFQAFAKKKAKNRLNTSRSQASTMTFELDSAEYTLLEKIGEGGFGAVFLAEDEACKEMVLESPEDYRAGFELVAIKTVSPSMLWEYAVLHVLRSSLPPSALPSIVAPREFYHFANESHLVMEYSAQGTLLDVVNNAAKMGVHAQDTSGIDELLIMFFAIELVRLIRHLHGEHFIHGDLKIDNCLLRLADPAEETLEATYDATGEGGWSERGVKLIDFGRTIDVGLFEPEQQFVGDWPTDARDCVEMQEGRPWTYQTDYAGLAGIIYCMMFGKFIETTVASSSPDGTRTFKVATPLKRYWQTDIWNRLYEILLNPTSARHDGTLPLVDELGEIEDEMVDWLTDNCEKKGKSLKKMLNQMYQYTKTHPPFSR